MTGTKLPPVDRSLFIPETIWISRDRKLVEISRSSDPDQWERLVASGDAIAPQLKDRVAMDETRHD